MASPVTRAVRFLSMVHTSVHAMGSRSQGLIQQSTNVVLTPDGFPRFLGLTMITSALAGFYAMEYFRHNAEQDALDQYVREQRMRQLARNQRHILERRYTMGGRSGINVVESSSVNVDRFAAK